jgi:hypothetical protein
VPDKELDGDDFLSLTWKHWEEFGGKGEWMKIERLIAEFAPYR